MTSGDKIFFMLLLHFGNFERSRKQYFNFKSFKCFQLNEAEARLSLWRKYLPKAGRLEALPKWKTIVETMY